jgi:hypothetical protein
MSISEFSICTNFKATSGQCWRCTDIGQRSIVAIEISPQLDIAWFNGPPYPVPEVVFDEIDIAAAFRNIENLIHDSVVKARNTSHPGCPHEPVMKMISARIGEESRIALSLDIATPA